MTLLCGVGICDIPSRENGTKTKAYILWRDMITRCYKPKQKSYEPCSVCEEWITFSNFKTWLDSQVWDDSYQIDKDLLVKGNTTYSPDTCVMLPREINVFLSSGNRDTQYLTGAFYRKALNKYQSRIQNPFTGKQEHLGVFESELDAHLKWKATKHSFALQYAKQYTHLPNNVLKALEEYYVTS